MTPYSQNFQYYLGVGIAPLKNCWLAWLRNSELLFKYFFQASATLLGVHHTVCATGEEILLKSMAQDCYV